MTWIDRILEAAYTPPSGNIRIPFIYEDVSKDFDKRGTAFNFPDAEGTFVQDMGRSGRRYPLRVFFSGPNHDLQANVFEKAIAEKGVGVLEHPVYGSVDVVPFGRIVFRDNLKTAANQTIIEMTFWATIGIVFPTAQNDPGGLVLSAIDEYNIAFADEFDDVIDLDSTVEQASFQGGYQALLNITDSILKPIADTQDNVSTQFDAIVSSINESIDLLISEPVTLALQTIQLIQTPARSLTNVQARLDGYANLIGQVLEGPGAIAVPGNDSTNVNSFHGKDLYVSTYVSGSILSVVNNEFETQVGALGAAEFLLEQFDSVTDWRDENYVSLGVVDTGASYQQLQEAVALAAGFLVEISFTLKQERVIVLDRNRTCIDVVAELYGSVDEQLDFFIVSNDLSGSEILELPKGREIVYYV